MTPLIKRPPSKSLKPCRHAHPTQGLLDMYTIRHYKGDFANLTVAIVGDVLHSRVAAITGVDHVHMGGHMLGNQVGRTAMIVSAFAW